MAACIGCSVTPVSPDGSISLQLKEDGQIEILHEGKHVLDITEVGITTTGHGGELQFKNIKKGEKITEEYEMIGGKASLCSNEAYEYTLNYKDNGGKPVKLVFRLYNDGVAFRYELSGLEGETLTDEATTYRIPEGTNRWIQRWTEAYEDFFPLSTTGKGRWSQNWGYPALLEPAEGVFALITEAGIERRQSASSLRTRKIWNCTRYVLPLTNASLTATGALHGEL